MKNIEGLEINKKSFFITNCGFCRQTLIGLTGLLWQSLLGHSGLLE